MNLLSILSKYKKEDAVEMEKESLLTKDVSVGLSSVEKWELNKITDNKPFDSFHKEIRSQSIEIEK